MDLCKSCISCVWCPTWGEKKCKELKTRIYSKITTCKHYKKRDKNFKEPKCQCESCLKNEKLNEE
jgi:hypothetical protein